MIQLDCIRVYRCAWYDVYESINRSSLGHIIVFKYVYIKPIIFLLNLSPVLPILKLTVLHSFTSFIPFILPILICSHYFHPAFPPLLSKLLSVLTSHCISLHPPFFPACILSLPVSAERLATGSEQTGCKSSSHFLWGGGKTIKMKQQ